MAKFRQFLTELYVLDMIVVGYYQFTFLFRANKAQHMKLKALISLKNIKIFILDICLPQL